MATAARLPLAAWRNELCVRTIRVVGMDLTGVDLRMQVRLRPDAPGAPLISLTTVTTAAAEGLKFEAPVSIANGVPTSTVTLRINKTTMSDATKLPYRGEAGDDTALYYAIQIGGTTRIVGQFIALANVIDSDGSTASASGYGSPASGMLPWNSAELRFTNDAIEIRVDGADALGPLVDRATDAASRAETAKTAMQPILTDLALPAPKLLAVATDLQGANNIGAVAANIAKIALLGTASNIANMAALADAAVIANMAALAAGQVIPNMALLAPKAAAMATLAPIADKIGIAADNAAAIATAANNIAGINAAPAAAATATERAQASIDASLVSMSAIPIADRTDIAVTTDSLGWVGARETRRGRITAAPIAIHPLALQVAADGKPVMHHFLIYGQSLGAAQASFPILTTAGMFPNTFMFNGGVNTAAVSEDPTVSMSSLVPYFEQQQQKSGGPLLGETPGGGFVARLTQVMRDRHGKSLAEAGIAVLVSDAAEPGLTIQQLSKTTTYYTRLIRQVTAAKALAEAAGYAYRLAGIMWWQGEADLNTPVATYLQRLQQLRTDLQTDIRAITGGTEPVRMFIVPTWHSAGLSAPYSHCGSTLAQFEAHKLDPAKFILLNPIYYYPPADSLHNKAFESTLGGAYCADAYLDEVIYGQRAKVFKPVIRPDGKIDAVVSGATVTIRFVVPSGQSLFDVLQASIAVGGGLVCTDNAGAVLPQVGMPVFLDPTGAVTTTGADRVRITLAAAPTSLIVKNASFETQVVTQFTYAGAYRPAYGARSNLRDNSGDLPLGIYRHPSGRSAPLHYWSIPFHEVVIP